MGYLSAFLLYGKGKKNMKESKQRNRRKFAELYMLHGMCYGVAVGSVLGLLLFPDKWALGICFGLSIGMGIGILAGTAKDRHISRDKTTGSDAKGSIDLTKEEQK